MMKKMAPKKAPSKMSPAMASRVRMTADKIMRLPKGDKDSAAGAAT